MQKTCKTIFKRNRIDKEIKGENMPDWWDFLTEKFGESWETFIGYFTNLSEFSTPGLIAGLIMIVLFIITKGFFIIDKVKVPSGQKLFLYIVGALMVFIVGYLFIKSAFDNG